jgi:hypothetical protein
VPASVISGGTILTSISTGEHAWTKALNISALVRNEAQASAVRAAGVKAVIMSSYDNMEAWTSTAKNHDSK